MTARTRTIVLIALLAGVGGWTAYIVLQRHQQAEVDAAVARAQEAELAKRQEVAREASKKAERDLLLPRKDYAAEIFPRNVPKPVSAWRSSEKAFYEELLAKGSFDVLVVPFQVQAYAIDRTSRSFMTAQLSAEIARGGNAKVPDPYLVARALGDGERRLPLEAIYRLADRLTVKRIVFGFVGYAAESDMSLRLTVQYQDRPAAGRFGQLTLPDSRKYQGRTAAGQVSQLTLPETRTFESVAFSDEHPPVLVFQALLPEILKTLGVATAGLPAAGPADVSLPSSPMAMVQGLPDAARDARYFQLLAALTPSAADRTRERFVEKSLLAAMRLPPDQPGVRMLKARALMQMGLRLAAIATLGKPDTGEEHFLAAVLDGNLPVAERSSRDVRGQIETLLATLDVNAMRSAFGIATADGSANSAQRMDLPKGSPWRFFLWRAMTDWDAWQQHDNAGLKQILDRDLPLAGASLNDLIGGVASLSDPARTRTTVDSSVLNHRQRLLQVQGEKWCCDPFELLHPTVLDYLDLVDGIATDNLMRRANLIINLQGAPQAGLDYVARLESVYKDHPQLALARSLAERGLGQRADGAAKEGYLRSAYVNAINAMYWEQGQTPASAAAFDAYASTGRRDYGPFNNLFATDYPYRSYYPAWRDGGHPARQLSSLQSALRNSAIDASPLRRLHGLMVGIYKESAKFSEVMRSVEGRFQGNPDVMVMKAELSAALGDSAQAVTHYRASIAAQPNHWDSYFALGRLMFEDGQINEASRLFQSYPGFKKGSRENPVGLSNFAFNAGSLFFWSGHFAQAIPLYKISAGLRTGSDGSMASAIRISLVNGDYRAAAAGSLERAQRYASPYGFRDFLGMLHAFGESEQAWNAFGALVGQIDAPQLWESALVGHRLGGSTEKQVAEWAGQDAMRRAGLVTGYSSVHLLRAGVTDRVPSANLPVLIGQIERPVWRIEDKVGSVVRPWGDGRSELVLGPDSPSEVVMLPTGVFQASKKAKAKSDLVYFAEAYRAMRMQDFNAASLSLQEAAKLYDMRKVQVGYMLPYLAFAAARAGQNAAAQQQLERFAPESRRFDYYLARAVLTGLGGKVEESLSLLSKARYRRPFTEHRPLLSEYQLAEISEWLYEATRDTRYRDFALAWAKQNQVSQPWFAWSYALEAKLSPNAEERRRAMAMAYYLDKNSERLASLPAKEVSAAVKEYAGRNPFIRANSAAKRGAA